MPASPGGSIPNTAPRTITPDGIFITLPAALRFHGVFPGPITAPLPPDLAAGRSFTTTDLFDLAGAPGFSCPGSSTVTGTVANDLVLSGAIESPLGEHLLPAVSEPGTFALLEIGGAPFSVAGRHHARPQDRDAVNRRGRSAAR
jgi:hypothetical protein